MATPGSRTTLRPNTVEPVRIGEGDVRWLKQTWSSQWLREPTAEELQGLVDDLLNEKLLAREAETMGLGEDDTIIRRRLAQKLKFLVEDTAKLTEPSEAELQAILCRQRQPLRDPGKTFVQADLFQPGASRGRGGGRQRSACHVEDWGADQP